MHRTTRFLALFFLSTSLTLSPALVAEEKRPHIVLVMADDQGWGDMAYQGHPDLKTPHFDASAARGLRFERFYAAAPVCSPTRASVLTGRHPNRMGVFKWGYPLRPQEITLAEQLREHGYATGHFGKWHLGSVRRSSPSHPGRHGFDRWVSAPNFYDLDAIMSQEGKAVPHHGDSSDIAVRSALTWMKETVHTETPLFAVVWFGSPHSPHRATETDRAPYQDQPEKLRHFLGEITEMDRAFGKLKQGLEDIGIRDNTVLWYCSDNGALPRVGSTGGFRGHKGQVYEGGLLVPAFIEWPARITQPRQTRQRCQTTDIFPTLLDIAGIAPPVGRPLDGKSLYPLIRGEALAAERALGFWDTRAPGKGVSAAKLMAELLEAQSEGRELPVPENSRHPERLPDPPHSSAHFPGHAAWIVDDWKLHRMEDKGGVVSWELYHLKDDPFEERNLLESAHAQATSLKPQLEAWLRSVVGSLNGADYPSQSFRFMVSEHPFGKTPEGHEVSLYTLENTTGWKAEIMTLGATLITMEMPDKHGTRANVNLRLDSLEDYLQGHPLLGSVVGRYANRIDGGHLSIDGERHPLKTVGGNGVHIHGGQEGFHKQLWEAEALPLTEEHAQVRFTHKSPDGHEGYPGNLEVSVTYTLTEEALILEYEATTDKPTHINLTNHAYWNLGGAGSGNVLRHELTLSASHYLDTDERKVPTGKRLPAEGAMDFRQPKPIGKSMAAVAGRGYDHCYVLAPGDDGVPTFAARVRDPQSGRVMEVWTTEPGVQLYTANYLSDRLRWKGQGYGAHHAVCLETQHFPDSPNHADFPSTLLRPGEVYRQRTEHRFFIEAGADAALE